MSEGSETTETHEKVTSPVQPQETHELGSIALSLRVPPFWRDRPRLWFISFEAATHDLKKSQAQLSQMVIAQLDKQDVEQIADLLYSPPAQNQYKILKERLISVYEESDGRQFQKLLQEMELGDQRPTQLLRRMRNLARDKVPDSTLRLMWMNHLPAHVRSVLVVSDTISKTAALDELALLADKMLEQNQEISAVAATPSSSSASSNRDTELLEVIKQLTNEIAELKSSQNYYRGRSPYRSSRPYRFQSRDRDDKQHRFPSRSRERSNTPSPYCYYHRRFGNNARRCTTPCTFKEDSKSEN